jgi:DNA-binding NarL/FixJ family response regulator
MTPLRVLLADDHQLVRAGLRSLLQQIGGVTVVAEAGDGREALALAAECRPDVALMDLSMPGLNGLEAVRLLRRDHPAVRVLVLSMHATEDYVSQALHAGAGGYLVKDAAPLELERALRAVMRGERFLSSSVNADIVERTLQRLEQGQPAAAVLTARQREILQLIAEGQGTKEIAFRLGLSVKTVETHRAQIMERLDIRDVAGLVRYALRQGLIEP